MRLIELFDQRKRFIVEGQRFFGLVEVVIQCGDIGQQRAELVKFVLFPKGFKKWQQLERFALSTLICNGVSQ
jgi:hypothetical protein